MMGAHYAMAAKWAAAADVFALSGDVRKCKCGTRLRRSNPGTLCGVCDRRAVELAIAEKDCRDARRTVQRERAQRERSEREAAKVGDSGKVQRRPFPKAGRRVSVDGVSGEFRAMMRAVAAKRPKRVPVNDLDPLPPARMCRFGCGLPVHLGKCKGAARFSAGAMAGSNGGAARVYKPGPRQAVAEIPGGALAAGDLAQQDLRQPQQYADPSLSEGHYAAPSGARGAAERYRGEQDYATCVIPLAEVPVATRPGRPPDPIAASRIEALWAKVERLELGKVLVVTCASSTEARSLVRRMRSRATIARACIRARRTAFDCYFWRAGE